MSTTDRTVLRVSRDQPGAVDLPDLAFVDSNCDGIDGTEKNAIFVAGTGRTASPALGWLPRARCEPVSSLHLSPARTCTSPAGTPGAETVGDVDIYGGYLTTMAAPSRCADEDRRARRRRSSSSGDTVVLQLLAVVGRAGVASGSTAYGIRAVGGSRLTLQRVNVVASAGVDGAKGLDGWQGARGGNGGRGESGRPATARWADTRGAVGGPAGNPGGWGGEEGSNGWTARAKKETGKTDTPGGAGGANGNPGKAGKRGAEGAPGKSGAHLRAVALALPPGGHSAGQDLEKGSLTAPPARSASPGMGGGGGGGGGGQKGRFS